MIKKKHVKIAIGILLLAVAIYFYPTLKDLADIEKMRVFLDQFGNLAPFVFMLIYIIAGIFMVPLSLFTILAGILFGTAKGFGIVLVAATIAAACGFLIARQFSTMVPQAKGGIIHKLQTMINHRLEESTFQTIVVLRLLYLNYMGLSYGAGLVKTCKFWPFVLATFLTNIVGSFVFVYLGGSLSQGPKALLIPAVLIVLTLMIPKVVKKLTNKYSKKKIK